MSNINQPIEDSEGASPYTEENGFCRGPYFDYDLSWNTSNPNLSICFRDTTLIGTPAIAFWLLTAIWIGYRYPIFKAQISKGIPRVITDSNGDK